MHPVYYEGSLEVRQLYKDGFWYIVHANTRDIVENTKAYPAHQKEKAEKKMDKLLTKWALTNEG